MAEITAILERIGLTKGESKVYLALLELGTSTTGPIIDKSGISASKVYGILDKLAKKGLVSYIVKEKTRMYLAQDPDRIIDYLDEEETKIKENKKSIQKILPELKLRKIKGVPAPVAEVLEGKKGFISANDKLFSEIEEGGEYYTLTNTSVSRTFYHYFEEFNRKRQERKISMWIIYPKETWSTTKEKIEQRKKRKGYYPRICPEELFVPTHIILGKSACLLCMISPEQIITIIIRNKIMIEGFKKYFKYVWSISKTPEGFPEYK
jgi:sugar-specific transcriptional regulator TrmB